MLAALVAALAFNELIHIIFEVWGVRQKVYWLSARIDQRPHGNWPINIDSLTKTLLLHSVLFGVCVGLAFGLLVWLGLAAETMLSGAIVLLIMSYSYTTLGMDAYHQDIGKLLRRYRRR